MNLFLLVVAVVCDPDEGIRIDAELLCFLDELVAYRLWDARGARHDPAAVGRLADDEGVAVVAFDRHDVVGGVKRPEEADL